MEGLLKLQAFIKINNLIITQLKKVEILFDRAAYVET